MCIKSVFFILWYYRCLFDCYDMLVGEVFCEFSVIKFIKMLCFNLLVYIMIFYFVFKLVDYEVWNNNKI